MEREPVQMVVVIGAESVREELWSAWAQGRDPWYLRRDVMRVDLELAQQLTRDHDGAVILTSQTSVQPLVSPAAELPDDPWQAHLAALDQWPDAHERLRQLRLYHLQRGYPVEHAPVNVDSRARTLGYLLRVHDQTGTST